jgi:hypothetical protein
VLLQWARNDGPITLHSIFKSRVGETLDLIEEFCFEDDGVTGFNLVYDWFHLCQTYTTLSLLKADYDSDCIPEDRIVDYAYAEKDARDGLCLKPVTCFDIMLHARKGPYQTLMDREDVTVKKVPTAIAWELAKELTKRIPLPDVYFARRLDSSIRWQVRDIYDDFGDIISDFKDVVLAFAPSSALKALAGDALKIKQEDIMFYTDVELPAKAYPIEDGFAPFALAPYFEKKHDRRILRQPNETDWFGKWPSVIQMHINHWSYNAMARKYGSDDVDYTRRLYEHFGSPTPGDDDSILACMVGAIRWRGFQLNIPAISALKDGCEKELAAMTEKINFNSVEVCRKYLEQVLGETEKLVLKVNDKISTKGIILEEIAKWKQEIVHDECQGQGCDKCAGGLLQSEVVHPAATRAQEILDARHAKKEIELYEKLLIAGRFHASFTIIGTLSSRMAGSDGLNPQGIKRSKEVRACFILAWPGMTLNGGDFDSFEVGLADAQYGDPVLHKDLTTLHDCFKCKTKGTINPDCDDCHGTGKEKTKIHGLFGTFLFPPMTYEQILLTKGLPGEKDKYTRSKNGVFCMLYGGEAYSLHTRVGIDEKVAEDAYQKWCSEYKVWGQERRKYFDLFCSMRQPGGIGTKVEWHDAADFIESMFGFRRYFTLENRICRALFDLAENPPSSWKLFKSKVTRRDRVQTVSGAVQSALFASAFAVQSANMRAGANHVIQSSGATLTKNLERRLWDIQPAGINHWRIMPLNIHDEVMAPTLPEYSDASKKIVSDFLDERRPRVPLIDMEWKTGLKNWSQK